MSQRVFPAFSSLNKQSQYQNTYELEEISRKHYGKEFFFPIVHSYSLHLKFLNELDAKLCDANLV